MTETMHRGSQQCKSSVWGIGIGCNEMDVAIRVIIAITTAAERPPEM